MRPTLLIVVSGLSLAAGPVPPAASAQATRWTFHGRDHADLWYAALAQLVLEGIGPLPSFVIPGRLLSRVRAVHHRSGAQTGGAGGGRVTNTRHGDAFLVQFSFAPGGSR